MKLFHVTNASRTKFVRVIAEDEKSAEVLAAERLRKGSKPAAKAVPGVKVGSKKTVRAVHANRGIEAKYRKKLRAMIDEIQSSVIYWMQAAYRKSPPRLAQDSTPSERIFKELRELADRWITKLEYEVPNIAEAYVSGMFDSSSRAFQHALKAAGWTVQFKMTPAVRDAFEASLAENISLIKSIPERYFQQVEGIVMRSYSSGRDLETMVAELKALYPAAAHRAELIARDQSNKANAVVNSARQMELGITRAKWMHSHAGKNPRPDHVAANGKEYDIAQGCLISGKYIQPGEEINCRCTSRPIIEV